ncbi:TetR/AcrR family transcriptional regulator [Gordonia alkaliphila]|uniref:TetR/AcrR family transcriptional regulator n=1 Tax=Gordonia alkaliphila TaxID=1053547 RepID=A0ABP8Z7Q0_9ACTN|nr:TetR/AcrR family transcriptional regulator [Gordonia alkaliphila]MCK0440106.1 TetR/AcrR family transcriptional regulator [Gordonia alkaliphila]
MTTTDTATGGSAAPRRTRMSPQQRRRQLLDLGEELATEQPLETVTIEAVAERAGVSRALIFHYFESKQDFHLALVQEWAEEMQARTLPPEDVDDPLVMLTASMTAYIDYVAENGDQFIAVLRGSLSTDPAMRNVAESTRSEMTRRILHHAPVLGIEVTGAVEMAVRGWTAFVEDVMIRWITDPKLTREQVLGVLVGSLPALAGAASLVAD